MRCLLVTFFLFSITAILIRVYSHLAGLNESMANEGECFWHNTEGVVVAPKALRVVVNYAGAFPGEQCTEALGALLNPRLALSQLAVLCWSRLTPSVFDFDIEVFFYYIKSTSVFLFFFWSLLNRLVLALLLFAAAV